MKEFSRQVIAAAKLILKENGGIDGGQLTDKLVKEFDWTTDGVPSQREKLHRKVTGVLGAGVRHGLFEVGPAKTTTRTFLH